MADQVEATFTAAMLDPACAEAVRSGLLTASLSSTGVDAVDVAASVALPDALGFAASPTLAAAPAPPELHVVPEEPDAAAERRREEAEQALAAAEHRVGDADQAAEAADRAVEELQARSLQQQSEIDELRRRLTDLEAVGRGDRRRARGGRVDPAGRPGQPRVGGQGPRRRAADPRRVRIARITPPGPAAPAPAG